MISTIVRQRVIKERFIEVRLLRLCILIFNLCVICTALAAYGSFNYGQKLLIEKNTELSHTVSALEKQYSELQTAKPLDPQIACPVWFTGANDLKTARDRLCSSKGR